MQQNETNMFYSFLKGSKRYFLIGIISAIMMTICDMLIPQIIRISVDSLIGHTALKLPSPIMMMVNQLGGVTYFSTHLWIIAVVIVLLAGLGAFFRWFSTLENAKGGETLVQNLHNRLYHHIAHLSYQWHNDHATGDIIQRCTTDVNIIKEFCANQLYNLIVTILMIVIAISFMATMHMGLTMIAVVFMPVIVGYSLVFHVKIKNQFAICDENEGVLSTIAQENLTGVRVVKAFGKERSENEKFKKQNNIYTDTWMKLCEYLAWFWAIGDLVSGVQVMAVVMIGALFCVQGTMSVGSYIAFISYNNMLVRPIRSLGRMISEMSKTSVSVHRISEILFANEEQDVYGEPATLTHYDIIFDHVNFSFGAKQVINDVSMSIPEGATIGILGRTGSGKSTLMYLLTRLYELDQDQGTITIGGKDIRQIPLAELRRAIGLVLQEPFLFSRTIGENINMTAKADQDILHKVSDVARLTETLNEFPDGYETMVGERGMTLSGGQKQRIAIARMLAEKTPIMIFDDSLSAVDAKTDSEIRRNLRQIEGATTILIAHRVQTLMHADYVYVMDHGTIIEQGTHEELLEHNGLYRAIYDYQSMSVEEKMAQSQEVAYE
ncbi:MAG: ABC transporter ATP-binding protein [Erysipelotrichaceae bacterium]|nr:ABC transporter ATP-binding protein [Erysipelotrichaceae bacterium]